MSYYICFYSDAGIFLILEGFAWHPLVVFDAEFEKIKSKSCKNAKHIFTYGFLSQGDKKGWFWPIFVAVKMTIFLLVGFFRSSIYYHHRVKCLEKIHNELLDRKFEEEGWLHFCSNSEMRKLCKWIWRIFWSTSWITVFESNWSMYFIYSKLIHYWL